MRWLNELMQNRIDKATCGLEFIESFSINMGNRTVDYDVINGLISRIMMQDIHPDGFKSITFSVFGYIADPIDKSVIDQLVSLSQNLTSLTINSIDLMSHIEQSFTYMIEQILQVPNLPLTHLNLSRFFNRIENQSASYYNSEKIFNKKSGESMGKILTALS